MKFKLILTFVIDDILRIDSVVIVNDKLAIRTADFFTIAYHAVVAVCSRRATEASVLAILRAGVDFVRVVGTTCFFF